MAARHALCGSQGMTPTESKIMDMHDGGASVDAIAAATGKSIVGVRNIINTFADRNDEGRARRAAANGSQMLLMAQLRAGQHQLSTWLAIARAAELGMTRAAAL